MPSCIQCHVELPVEARFCPRCGTPQKKVTVDPMLNQKLDERYLVLELVGEGGSGKVYMARHVELGKRVAVKILHRALIHDTQAAARFRKEAQAVANLDNPHILQVFDYGHTPDGSPYIVMEFLYGETLATRMHRKQTLSLKELLPILKQISDGLGEAHALGYVHRDLRPRNIMLVEKEGNSDFVKILDFGLAKILHPSVDPSVSGVGFVFGDPTYSAPETMKSQTVDGRTDIYSLGVIVYQALSGHPPFVGDTVFDVMSKHLDAEVPPLEGTSLPLPRGIDVVLAKTLAKDPQDRYRTVLQFFEALAALEQQPIVPPKHAVKHPVIITTNSYLNLLPPVPHTQTPVFVRMPGGGVLQMTPELAVESAKANPTNTALPENCFDDVVNETEDDELPLKAPSQSFIAREELRLQERMQEHARMRRLWLFVFLGAAIVLSTVWGIRSCQNDSETDMLATTSNSDMGTTSLNREFVPMETETTTLKAPMENPLVDAPMETETTTLKAPMENPPIDVPMEEALSMTNVPMHEPIPMNTMAIPVEPVHEKPDTKLPKLPETPTIEKDDLTTARELYASGQVDRAFEIAMSVARLNPSNTAAWQLAGECAFETGHWQAAEAAYAKLVQLQSSAKNLYRLGSAQLKQGKTVEARSNFQKSLEIDPQFGPAKIALEKLP